VGFYIRKEIPMRARITLLAAALTLAASGAGASLATASAPVTPINGSNGACNMTNANAAYGMFNVSFSHANSNGWDTGMSRAITNSTGGTPINCDQLPPPPRP
jgi:hypothetical protein